MRSTGTLAAIVLSSFAAAFAAQSTPTSTPALQAIEQDVRSLYQSTVQHVVRVMVPIRVNNGLVDQQHPLIKWGPQIDPMLQSLADAARKNGAHVFVDTARPVTQVSATTQAVSPAVADSTRVPLPTQSNFINVEFIGLVLDSQGNVLLPLYIESAAPLQVTLDDKSVTTATLIAADRLTALSVVRSRHPAGKPAAFADENLVAGSLVLLMSPTRRLAKLGVWTGTADENAILVDSSGNFSAIVRNGHALFPATYRPVVNQLVSGGPVKRAQLGVVIFEVGADDPIRTKLPALGSRPAARVQEIIPGSAAQRAGLLAGDLILSLNDDRVEDIATFAAAIANCRGSTQLHILRAGEAQTIAVDLQPQ